MDYLTQQMNFGLSVEDTIDYDKWVREHPFDNPQAPDGQEMAQLSGFKFDGEPSYESAVAYQALYIKYCFQFEAYYEALIKWIVSEDVPRDELRAIYETLKDLPKRPFLLGPVDRRAQEVYGEIWHIKMWIVWDLWFHSFRLPYVWIADYILNKPFPEVHWSWGSVRDTQEEDRLKRLILAAIPTKLTREEVEVNEVAVKEELRLRGIENGLDMMTL